MLNLEGKMKILLINSVCGYGSTGRIVVDLAKTYMAHGHQCIIAYGRDNFSKESEKQMKMEFSDQCTFYQIGGRMHKINNMVHGIESRILDNHGFTSYYPTKQFVSWLEEEKPDVIHLHNLHGYYIHVGVLFDYIKKNNIKTIWTLHDCWSFTGHCSYFDYAQCDRWKEEGCNHCPQKKEYPSSLFLDCSQHNFAAKKKVFQGVEDLTLVTPSYWLKEQVEQSILSGYPCKVIPNGIDLEVFCPKNDGKIKEDELEKKKKYIVHGVASVWNQRKGLSCFGSLAKKLPENYQIVLIGLNEKQLQELERKKESKEYLRKIQGVLRTNSVDELAEYYRNADVFVNPTLEDNFPTTNLEALACGTPVVTYQTGGSPECLVGEEKAGIVVEKGNIRDLIKGIRKICEKPESEKIQQKRSCCRQAGKFGKQEKYEEYMKLFHAEGKRDMKILYLTNIPSPYRVDFFNELGKKVNLTVLFERNDAKDRDAQWLSAKIVNFKGIFLEGKGKGNDSAFCPSVRKYLRKEKYDIFVVGGYSTPTGMFAIECLKFRGIPFFLNCDGGMVKQDNFLQYAVKKYFIGSASAWLTTGKQSDEYLVHYGAKKDRILHYPFTSVSQKDIFHGEDREEVRRQQKGKLGITEKKMILSVGQFIERKGFDLLIKAMAELKKRGMDESEVCLYLIGGQPTREYKELVEKNCLKNIRFLDFMPKEELKRYYLAADIFAFPTREDIWGLVINEAMAAGLPVVTTNQCVAGMEMIENGENGYLIPSDSVEELTQKLCILLRDKKLAEKMGWENLKKIEKYTIERMAKRHLKIFEK